MADADTPEKLATPEPQEPRAGDAAVPVATADDPLAAAILAVDHGNYARARQLAAALATHEDEAVRRRALAMVDQLGTDPVIVAVMSFTGLLMLTLFLLYQHAH